MDVFFTPKLKLERARKHVDDLKNLTSPLSKELYEIKIDTQFELPKPYAIGKTLVYKPLKPLSETFGLIIGDAISNYRAALDHLASGIVKEVTPKEKPYFPMSVSRSGMASHSSLSKLEAALPGSSELLLQKIRPEDCSDEIYWNFHDLDNDNKHNIILPTVSGVNIDNMSVRVGESIMENVGFGGNAAAQINMIQTNGTPIHVSETHNVNVNLTFQSDSQFPNMNVIETLVNIGKIVEKTIEAFEALYIETRQ
ncbi:hypothetical protein KW465_12825 [Vibrio fluvialis]|nr:hypothetical protein [Vibrio fluvialis]